MPFGKYRGEDLGEIPAWYIQWLLREVPDLDPDLRENLEDEMEARRRANLEAIRQWLA